MESFTIQCTSCESRIRVRNPNMIGQIANCPKCGSMILISAPEKITVESGNPTDSVAVTREALPTPDTSVLNGQSVFETGFRIDGLPEPPPSSSAAGLSAEALPSPPLVDEYHLAAVEESEPAATDPVPMDAWLPAPDALDPAPPPRTDIDASIQAVRAKRQESAAKSRQVMLVATIGLCSVLIAVGILVAFLRWVATPKVVAQNKPADAKQPLAEVPPSDPGDASAGSPQSSAQTGVMPEESSVPAVVPHPVTPAELPLAGNNALNPNGPNNGAGAAATVIPQPNPATKVDTDPKVDAGAVASDNPGAAAPTMPAVPGEENGQANTPATIGNSSAPKKPLGGSIAPDLDAVLGSDMPTPGEPNSNGPTELPPGLQGFSRLFNQGFEPVLPDASVPLEKPAEVKDDPNKAAGNAAAGAPAADLLPANVDKLLKASVPGMLINQRPLSEALTTLSLLSDIPTVADLDSLLVAGASKDTLVKVRVTQPTPFEAVLGQITESSNVSFVPLEGRVLYARASNELLTAQVPGGLEIADLVADQAQRDQLLQAIKDLLPELGDAVQLGEGELQLALTDQNRLTWFQVARLLETWRTARGLTNDKSRVVVPAKALLPAWPVEAMQNAARAPIKQLLPAEPVARTWQRITAEARVACWVDWHGLLAGDINPRQKSTVIASGRSLAEVLQHYANKYGLVVAIEDSRALWITSPEMHRIQNRLYVVSLAEKSMEEWTAELESLAPINPANNGNMLKLVPTPDGQYLFVRCCRPLLVKPN